MSVETQNQSSLHEARQDQLVKSKIYTQTFISKLNPEKDYDIVQCPTCEQKSSRKIFTKNGGDHSYCDNCNHIFLANCLKEDKLIEFYSGYPTSHLEWHKNESDFYNRIYQKGLDQIIPATPGTKLLDIGCSSGYFLSLATEQGLETFGIEPNRSESDYAIENGIKVIGSTISDLHTDTKFDVITLWDVLEHIRGPVNYLREVRKFLNPNGVVFVQVPSSDSLAARVMRDACNMFDGIEHLTLFSARSVDIAFSNAGYLPIKKQTVISEIFALSNYLCYMTDPYLAENKNSSLAEFLSADTIESSGLGYKIQAIYRVA